MPRDRASLLPKRRFITRLSQTWAVSVGTRHDDRSNDVPNASTLLSQNGERTDAIVRFDYKPLTTEGASTITTTAPIAANALELGSSSYDVTRANVPADAAAEVAARPASWQAYTYMQGTVDRTGDRDPNDRFGIGAAKQLHDRFRLGGEASEGDGGFGGKLSGDYQIDDRSNVYLGARHRNRTAGLELSRPIRQHGARRTREAQRSGQCVRRSPPRPRRRTGQPHQRVRRRSRAERSLDLRREIRSRHGERSAGGRSGPSRCRIERGLQASECEVQLQRRVSRGRRHHRRARHLARAQQRRAIKRRRNGGCSARRTSPSARPARAISSTAISSTHRSAARTVRSTAIAGTRWCNTATTTPCPRPARSA